LFGKRSYVISIELAYVAPQLGFLEPGARDRTPSRC